MSAETVLRVTDEEQDRIMKHVDRSEADLEVDLQTLRDWLRKEPHLPNTEDDRILRTMLLVSKCSLERVKAKLDACYTYKSHSADVYTDNEPLCPNMQTVMEQIVFLPLPHLMDDCSRVIVVKSGADADGFIHLDCVRYFMSGMELMLRYDRAHHVHALVDFDGFTFAHLKQISPTVLLKNLTFFTSVFPNSIKGCHFVNVPSFTQSLIQLMKSAMKGKMAERVHIHKDMDCLHAVISRNVLPVEYGGTEKPLLDMYADWRKFVEDHNDWIRERARIKSNESLRIGAIAHLDIYGAEGSFRKLNVD